MDYRNDVMRLIREDESIIPALLNIANNLYREHGVDEIKFRGYSFKRGDILFDDNVYDRYKKKVGFIEPALNATQRPKIKQKHFFGTLEKFTDSTLQKYIKRLDKVKDLEIKQLIITPKYDGVSMRIYYGKFCVTRYNSEFGIDITPKCYKVLQKLKLPANSIVRGELITSKDHEGFSDKRTYVSGKVNDMEEFPDDIDYVPYEYLEEADGELVIPNFIQQLRKIKNVFGVIHECEVIKAPFSENLTKDVLQEFFDGIQSKYPMDGLVIKPNEIGYEKRDQPEYQVAYKFDVEQFDGVVDHINWTVKQKGFLQPTIVLREAVNIEGVQVNQATGVNLKFLFNQNLANDRLCRVSKKVVPRIVGFGKQTMDYKLFAHMIVPEECPNCQGPVVVKDGEPMCKEYFEKKCYLKTIVARAVDIMKIPGLGKAKQQFLIQEEDFNLKQWLEDLKPTKIQLFCILSDGMQMKTAEKEYTEEEYMNLKQKYKLL